MKLNSVCVLGGTGFVGRHLVARLAEHGYRVRVLSRHPQRHRDLLVNPGVELVSCNIHDVQQLTAQFKGLDAAINLVGILNERRDGDFRRVHVDLVDKVADACRNNRVTRLLHMSALNASATEGPSLYLTTKGEGANRAHSQAGLKVTSFRPSVIFGPDDSFFNRFAALLRVTPGIFPLACPDTRFAPVYVGDVAEAFCTALDDKSTWGKRYELCGPKAYTLKALVEYTAGQLGLRRWVIGLNPGLSRLQARILGLAPGKPFSYDNYLSLQRDSVCTENGLGLLGIEPTAVEAVVPLSLARQGQRQRYNRLRKIY
jgi:NADH dehydrogenase